MIRSKHVNKAAVAILTVGLTGCMSAQNSTLDAIESVMRAQPFVEGFVEFGGPRAQWAGPSSIVLHVVARDAAAPGKEAVEITFTPELFAPALPELTMGGARTPASTAGDLSVESAREQFARLASALGDQESPVSGCLSPLRVRLVRADGALLERQGCRDEKGWPRVASEMMGFFMAVKQNRVQMAAAKPEPEAKPATPAAASVATKAAAHGAEGAKPAAPAAEVVKSAPVPQTPAQSVPQGAEAAKRAVVQAAEAPKPDAAHGSERAPAAAAESHPAVEHAPAPAPAAPAQEPAHAPAAANHADMAM